jgi:glycogen operon protein
MNRLSPEIHQGMALPLGVSFHANRVNFALFSRHAEAVSLVLFKPGKTDAWAEMEFDPKINKTGDIWHIMLGDLPYGTEYGYRLVGPYDPKCTGHYYKADRLLLDPYCHSLANGAIWGAEMKMKGRTKCGRDFIRRGVVAPSTFDWQGDRPLNIPLKDSIIYEMHVRGFTKHTSSRVKHPGTYRGLIEKIPYLKKLGITAVELMPVNEFSENEKLFMDPQTGEYLKNYWGYNPMAFFAPKASYAADGVAGGQVDEFKEMVRALHKAGIEVILDVVFNHTGEGDYNGTTYSFRGIDNTIYYILGKEKHYMNYSGCGNTINCNHPLVRNFIMDCLRYWVMEMHVDGFRFDLASILGRSPSGEVLRNPPMVEQIAEDPVLANTKIIAEAWDAAGVYQVGSFSTDRRWAEWNGKFRDDIRSFMCGTENSVAHLATRIAGSSDLYQWSSRTPYNSINFITSHDGFTLADLVSYNEKHNERNGEQNRDGDNHNISWNSGAEGVTDDRDVLSLRKRRVKTMAVLLMLSQGVPMLVAGDEFGRSQQGNNNGWCQDNELSWLNWQGSKDESGLRRFFTKLIGLRKKHQIFRRCDFFAADTTEKNTGIRWWGEQGEPQRWDSEVRSLGFILNGGGGNGPADNDFLILVNGGLDPVFFTLPALDSGYWCRLIDTVRTSPADFIEEKKVEEIEHDHVTVAGMAAVVLISRGGAGGC